MVKNDISIKLYKQNGVTPFLSRFKESYFSYFLMYNFYYLSWSLFSSFISVYLLDKGYQPREVSLVVSVSFLTSMLFQPLIGVLNDKYNVTFVNALLFGVAALGGIYFLNVNQLFEIIIGYSLVLTLINGTNPVMEKIATTSPYSYGRIRIWGTIGYALGSQIAGLLYDFVSARAIFITFVLTMVITIIGLLGTKTNQSNEKTSVQTQSYGSSIFKNKKYLYYLLIASLFFGITNTGHTFTPAYFQSMGLSVSSVSIIVSLAVICEAPIVLFSYKFMDKISNKKLLIIAFLMIMSLYLIYAFRLWLPLQIFATFIIKHPAGMLFIMINLKVVSTLVDPKYQITALAFVQTCRNLSSVVFQNIGGQILNSMPYQTLFFYGLILMMIGLVMVIVFKLPSGNDKNLFH